MILHWSISSLPFNPWTPLKSIICHCHSTITTLRATKDLRAINSNGRFLFFQSPRKICSFHIKLHSLDFVTILSPGFTSMLAVLSFAESSFSAISPTLMFFHGSILSPILFLETQFLLYSKSQWIVFFFSQAGNPWLNLIHPFLHILPTHPTNVAFSMSQFFPFHPHCQGRPLVKIFNVL